MSVWAIVGLVVASVWLAGALFAAGLLWEREHMLGNAETRKWGWWGAYVFSSACWPWLLWLWGDSRPVPQPSPMRWPEDYRGKMFVGGKDIVDVFSPPEGWEGDWAPGPGRVMQVMPSYSPRELLSEDEEGLDRALSAEDPKRTMRPTWEYLGPITVVDKPGTLPLSGVETLGSRVYVKALGFVLVREELAWGSSECSCRYNFNGFPVVLCRSHRVDTDPQGEPHESEGDEGL